MKDGVLAAKRRDREPVGPSDVVSKPEFSQVSGRRKSGAGLFEG